MKKVLVVAVALTLILSVSAFAGNNFGVGKAAVHLAPHASRTCAKGMPVILDCHGIVTTDPGPSVDAFPVFFDLVEYQGFDYGMTFVSPYTCAFTSCSNLTIGGIVNSGDGISHAWYLCQAKSIAICGFGWLYSYGMICIVPHPTAGGPVIGDCQGGLDLPICLFCSGTYGFIGDDPCAPTATEASTWGSIKGMFR